MQLIEGSFDSIRRAAQEVMKRYNVPGAALAAIKNGETVLTQAIGTSHADGSPVTEGTYFEAASLTKPVFAYLVLCLEREGAIDLDTPLVKYRPAPSDDPRAASITARHVLCHATGLPNWGKRPLPLSFDPGKGFRYSGEGYSYLQRCVERITKRRLDDLLQEYVFDPFGMEQSAMIWTGAIRTRLASTFDENGKVEKIQRTGARHASGYEPNAAFSLYVNIREYPRFLENLMKSDFIARINETQNPVAEKFTWGLGWGQYEGLLWHWGDNGGFKSFVCFDPVTRDALLVHTNGVNGLEVGFSMFELTTGMSAREIRILINDMD